MQMQRPEAANDILEASLILLVQAEHVPVWRPQRRDLAVRRVLDSPVQYCPALDECRDGVIHVGNVEAYERAVAHRGVCLAAMQ